jgi:hypothetical protein
MNKSHIRMLKAARTALQIAEARNKDKNLAQAIAYARGLLSIVLKGVTGVESPDVDVVRGDDGAVVRGASVDVPKTE